MRKGEPYKEPDIYKPADNQEYQFFGTEIENPIVCKWFGCVRHLTHSEKLFGNYCVHHQNRKPFSVTQFLKYP